MENKIIEKQLKKIKDLTGKDLQSFYSEHRYKHVVRVAEKFVKNIENKNILEEVELDMFILAILFHDIGLELIENKQCGKQVDTLYNNLYSYQFTKDLFHSDFISSLILMSGYYSTHLLLVEDSNKYYKQSIKLLKDIENLYEEDKNVLQALKVFNACELTTDEKGNDISLIDKLKEVEGLYGRGSKQYIHMDALVHHCNQKG